MNSIDRGFCNRHNITSDQLDKLKRLERTAVKAQERWHNEEGVEVEVAAEVACEEINRYIIDLGLNIQWPGLYPIVGRTELETIPV